MVWCIVTSETYYVEYELTHLFLQNRSWQPGIFCTLVKNMKVQNLVWSGEDFYWLYYYFLFCENDKHCILTRVFGVFQSLIRWLPESLRPEQVNVVLTGKDEPNVGLVNVMSYELLVKKSKEIQTFGYQVIIVVSQWKQLNVLFSDWSFFVWILLPYNLPLVSLVLCLIAAV